MHTVITIKVHADNASNTQQQTILEHQCRMEYKVQSMQCTL